MQFSVLASGSRANSAYIEAGGHRLLIDCGLSARETEKRLRSIGVEPDSLDFILISHEHGDHIRGISVLSRRYDLQIFVSEKTSVYLENCNNLTTFRVGDLIEFSGISIRTFPVCHDAVEPCGFVISSENARIFCATDLGRVTPAVMDAAAFCNAMIIESNYDDDLLWRSEYPWSLKNRISSDFGHLSNEEASRLVREVDHAGLEHVVLAHASENSNLPERALETFFLETSFSKDRSVVCAGAKESTELLDVLGTEVKQLVNY